jgi:hypothetical protein
MKRARLTRDVSPEQYPWLGRELREGTELVAFRGATYGCIGPDGVAMSLDGDNPFFEIPRDALEWLT